MLKVCWRTTNIEAMNIPFDRPPFSELPDRLRPWLVSICESAKGDPDYPLWRAPLPDGSSMSDVLPASECILALFPERLALERNRRRCRRVDVEFKL